MNDQPSNQFRRRLVMSCATLMTVVYLVYRGLFTLNLASPYAVAASLVLYAAECYGGFLMFLFFFQIWDTHDPPPVPSVPGRTVDVMIPTYNEDPQLLRGTIVAALAIDYPHRTLVLDDGKRAEVKALCEELGAEYITRPTNLHAKAGNLNHALEKTDGELVVIFDADHVSERHFIDRLVGYFEDERLGFVQTPHAFYNFDAFQGVLNYERGLYWEEGMLFYNVTQPGKNRWNAVTFCGSAAIFRRQALEEVGLIATQSITEDMHTGLRMHAKGWKSLFVNERLIAAMAAEDITSFNTQRLRWGEGNLGIFAFDNPLTMPGLTLPQRLCYLGSMLSWTTGVQKLLIYLTPLAMLLTGVAPVRSMTWPLALITAAYLASVWGGVKLACNGYGRLLAIELAQMTCFWTNCQATWRALFHRKRAKFVVTSKRGRQSNSVLRQLAPQILYIVGSTAAITWAVCRLALGMSNDVVGVGVGAALLIVNCYFAWAVVRRALRRKDRRASWRHPVALHVAYKAEDPQGNIIAGQGITRDINEMGCGLILFEPLPPKSQIELTIAAADRSVTARATIRQQGKAVQLRSSRSGTTQAFVYGLQFVEPTKAQLEELWWLGAQFGVGRNYERFDGGQFGLGSVEPRKLPARTDELAFELPLCFDSQPAVGVTQTIGPETLTALLPPGFFVSQPVTLHMATPFGRVEAVAEVAESKTRNIAGRTVHETRLRYRRFADESRSTLQSALGHHDAKELASIVRSRPHRRPARAARSGGLLLGVAGLAAAAVVGCVLLFQRDEATLATAQAGHRVSDAQLERLSQMVASLKDAPSIDEPQVLRLRAVMARLGRDTDVAAIDAALAANAPRTLDGLICKAESLQQLNRRQEADVIYHDLIDKLDDLHDDRTRSELLLAAARNAANLGHGPDALDRYARLCSLGPLDDDARREYAGVLFHNDRRVEARRLLSTAGQSDADRRLLASFYAAEHRFADAVATYREILVSAPADREALRGVADNCYWDHDFAAAADGYRAVLRQTPDDASARESLANSLLYGKQFYQAASVFADLIDRSSHDTLLWEGFLSAAAGSAKLPPAEQRILERIYSERSRSGDDRFLKGLLDAISRHGSLGQSVDLLRQLAERHPDDARLRLRLADALAQLGRNVEADVHYRWLLAHTGQQAAVRLPQLLPTAPAQ